MSIKPDIIVCWPRNTDYPLWRQFIHDNRDRFNLVIVVFTETHQGEDYREFVRGAMASDWVLFADSPIVHGEDWRNVAVNYALIQSYNAEWIWFTEQDFFIDNPGDFFIVLNKAVESGPEWAAYFDGPRMHPCCLFVKRELLNKTSKNFAANPPHYDHFGKIQKDLEEITKERILLHNGVTHMAGLSHNFRLVADGGLPNYKPEEFNVYICKCLAVSVPQSPIFNRVITEYLNRISNV